MSFKPVEAQVNFDNLEKQILAFWKKNKIFEKSVKAQPKSREFVFYDGPPFATGLPHYGHIVPGTVKDIIPRYWTMKGYRVERRFGWDCHGLPIEYQLEKELQITSKKEIRRMGIDKFNEKCRGIVLRYVKEWEEIVPRLGRWVDFNNDYKTMDPHYMESIWWVFKQLYEKGLIYEGYKSLHVCPRCETPLSNFEVTLGYKDKKDPSVVIKFPLKGVKKTFILAWTTTPWTLPGNVLLAINSKLTYVKVQADKQTFILAEPRVKEIFANKKITAIDKISLEDLVGKNYEPLYPLADIKKAYRVVKADFVSAEEGTGIVHIAPAFGEDDYLLGQKEKAAFVQHINPDGLVNKQFGEYEGTTLGDLNKKIITDLDKRGKLFSFTDVIHSYPFCWRCETPLMNYATKSWFLAVTKIKDKLIKNNKKIYWIPKNIKYGRFGRWLEQARDWAISRNRFWGTPLPVWRCDKTGKLEIIGSIKELESRTGKRINDLHLHKIMDFTWKNEETGGIMRLSGEVLDCWFESGSMPYAFNHYPFENKKWFEAHFPADFIAESIDQTRGWFYTLHVLASALFDRPAFENVVSNGVVLAENGQKMSKSKKNYPDPMLLVKKYGADSLRFYLMSSPVIKGEDLCFSEKGVLEVNRNVFIRLWNVYRFFVAFANLNNWEPVKINPESLTILDKWILTRLDQLVFLITRSLEKYDISKALSFIPTFIEDLSLWYLRRSRERMHPLNKNKNDRDVCFATLNKVLKTFTKVLAPFCPFISEEMFKNLTNEESVHLSKWPEYNQKEIDPELEEQMQMVRNLCALFHSRRKEKNIKVRIPVRKVVYKTWERLPAELETLIREEGNIYELKYQKSASQDLFEIGADFSKTNLDEKAGEAREIIRKIQMERKKMGCRLTDWLEVTLPAWPMAFEKEMKNKTITKKLVKGGQFSVKVIKE